MSAQGLPPGAGRNQPGRQPQPLPAPGLAPPGLHAAQGQGQMPLPVAVPPVFQVQLPGTHAGAVAQPGLAPGVHANPALLQRQAQLIQALSSLLNAQQPAQQQGQPLPAAASDRAQRPVPQAPANWRAPGASAQALARQAQYAALVPRGFDQFLITPAGAALGQIVEDGFAPYPGLVLADPPAAARALLARDPNPYGRAIAGALCAGHARLAEAIFRNIPQLALRLDFVSQERTSGWVKGNDAEFNQAVDAVASPIVAVRLDVRNGGDHTSFALAVCARLLANGRVKSFALDMRAHLRLQKDESTQKIVRAAAACATLTSFHMAFAVKHSKDICTVIRSFKDNAAVHTLSLEVTHIEQEVKLCLPREILHAAAQCPRLTEVRVDCGGDARALSWLHAETRPELERLMRNCALHRLVLSIPLSQDVLGVLLEGLSQNTTLGQLDLTDCGLGRAAIQSVAMNWTATIPRLVLPPAAAQGAPGLAFVPGIPAFPSTPALPFVPTLPASISLTPYVPPLPVLPPMQRPQSTTARSRPVAGDKRTIAQAGPQEEAGAKRRRVTDAAPAQDVIMAEAATPEGRLLQAIVQSDLGTVQQLLAQGVTNALALHFAVEANAANPTGASARILWHLQQQILDGLAETSSTSTASTSTTTTATSTATTSTSTTTTATSTSTTPTASTSTSASAHAARTAAPPLRLVAVKEEPGAAPLDGQEVVASTLPTGELYELDEETPVVTRLRLAQVSQIVIDGDEVRTTWIPARRAKALEVQHRQVPDAEMDKVFPVRAPRYPQQVHPLYADDRDPTRCAPGVRVLKVHFYKSGGSAAGQTERALWNMYEAAMTAAGVPPGVGRMSREQLIAKLAQSVTDELEATMKGEAPPSSRRTRTVKLTDAHCAEPEKVLVNQWGCVPIDYANQPSILTGSIVCLFAGAKLMTEDDFTQYAKAVGEERTQQVQREYAAVVRPFGKSSHSACHWAPFGTATMGQTFNAAFDADGRPDEQRAHAEFFTVIVDMQDKHGRKQIETMYMVLQTKLVREPEQMLVTYGPDYQLQAEPLSQSSAPQVKEEPGASPRS